MLSQIAEKLKRFERLATILSMVLVALFCVLTGIEFYRYADQPGHKLEYLFFTLAGGLFAVLFYICIVYFCVMKAARIEISRNMAGLEKYVLYIKKAILVVMAIVFIYAAINTMVENLTRS